MLDAAMIPRWAVIDGHLFRRRDLERSRPAWWWTPGRAGAWRGFRIRLAVAQQEVEGGTLDPVVCWAEIRLFLTEGDSSALDMARAVSARAGEARLWQASRRLEAGHAGFVPRRTLAAMAG